jgi:two-component system cell cycle response regulator
VALGTLISATLTEGDVGENVEAMRSCARDWFSLDENASRGLQDQARVQGRELARSLEVHLGDPVDVPVILATAQERLLETQIETSKELDDLRRATSELSRQADIDTLTGAHTRKHFDTRLGALFADSIATGAPLGLLFIDADRFKSINDTHGHKVGDTVLVGLVDRIRGAVGIRGEVCRVGGEEFTVLLPGASLEVATGVGREVQTAVAASPLKVRGESVIRALRATVSVGVASLDRSLRLGFSGPAALLEAADRAVYRAKAAGGNGVCAAGPQPAASKKRAA